MNIVLRSGIKTSDDKEKYLREEGWIPKAPKKEVGFGLECAKEKFMEAKKSFTEASTSGSQKKLWETSMPTEVDPSLITTFLETCMKLLRDSKAMNALKELIKNVLVKKMLLMDTA